MRFYLWVKSWFESLVPIWMLSLSVSDFFLGSSASFHCSKTYFFIGVCKLSVNFSLGENVILSVCMCVALKMNLFAQKYLGLVLATPGILHWTWQKQKIRRQFSLADIIFIYVYTQIYVNTVNMEG